MQQNWAVVVVFWFFEVGLGEAGVTRWFECGMGEWGGKGCVVFLCFWLGGMFGCLDGLRHLVLRCATGFVFGWSFCS